MFVHWLLLSLLVATYDNGVSGFDLPFGAVPVPVPANYYHPIPVLYKRNYYPTPSMSSLYMAPRTDSVVYPSVQPRSGLTEVGSWIGNYVYEKFTDFLKFMAARVVSLVRSYFGYGEVPMLGANPTRYPLTYGDYHYGSTQNFGIFGP